MDSWLDDFSHYLSVEKGLAQNTLESYRRDIRKYLAYLRKEKIEGPGKADRAIITGYLHYLKEAGHAPSTISRNIASLRSFYFAQKIAGRNPAQQPRLRALKKLPRVLTTKEVDRLLGSPHRRQSGLREALTAKRLRISYGLVALSTNDS